MFSDHLCKEVADNLVAIGLVAGGSFDVGLDAVDGPGVVLHGLDSAGCGLG